MKKTETIKITTGAMFVAIFTIILIINRYSGAMFEELIMYILPIPMVAYSAKFGFKSGLPVLAAMVGMSVIFGTFTTIFYAGTEAFIGLVFGSRIYRKADMTITIALVMVLSVIANVLNTIVLASLFGYNVAEEVAYMQDAMNEAIDMAAQMSSMSASADQLIAMKSILTTSYLTRIYIVSMIILGIVQGYLVYVISLLILNRLRFQLPKPKGILAFYPPKWTGFLAVLMFLCYGMTFNDDYAWLQDTMQTLGMCGYLYLVIFGAAAVILLMRRYVTNKRLIPGLVAFLGMMTFPQIEMFLGLFYICSDMHKKKVAEMEAIAAEQAGRRNQPGDYSGYGNNGYNNGYNNNGYSNGGNGSDDYAQPALMQQNGENQSAASGNQSGTSARKYNGNNYRSTTGKKNTTGKKSMRDKSMLVMTLLEQDAETANSEPANSEPANSESANSESANNELANIKPTNSEPGNSEQ